MVQITTSALLVVLLALPALSIPVKKPVNPADARDVDVSLATREPVNWGGVWRTAKPHIGSAVRYGVRTIFGREVADPTNEIVQINLRELERLAARHPSPGLRRTLRAARKRKAAESASSDSLQTRSDAGDDILELDMRELEELAVRDPFSWKKVWRTVKRHAVPVGIQALQAVFRREEDAGLVARDDFRGVDALD